MAPLARPDKICTEAAPVTRIGSKCSSWYKGRPSKRYLLLASMPPNGAAKNEVACVM